MEQKFLSDEIKVSSIFPEEICLIIFKELDDPTDLLSTANASPVFEQYLGPVKNCYLPPQVLQILTKKQYLDGNDSKALLKCRMVCSRWRRAINKLLEIRPYQFKLNQPKGPGLYNAWFVFNFYDDEEYAEQRDDIARGTKVSLYAFPIGKLQNEVLPALSTTHYQTQNPFPSRQLRLCEHDHQEQPNEQRRTDYRNSIMQILEKVGHHLWHVEIQMEGNRVREWYPLLRKYVQLMPNIKTLNIESAELNARDQRNHEAENVTAEMPFPRLNHCQHLEAKRIPSSIISHIFTVNDHVENVEIYRVFPDKLPVSQVGLPRNLYFHIVHADEVRMLPASAPLHYLRLETNEFRWASLRLVELFDKLECYSETLVKLYLETPLPAERDSAESRERPTKPLNLPKLKRLRIKLDHLIPLDFLLGLKSLEYLSLGLIVADRKVAEESGHLGQGCINFYNGYENRFMECNIWDLIPSLQKVELEYTIEKKRRCIRQMFNRLSES